MVGQYKEPLGGHPTLLSILPIDKIEPTPFQRDLSDTHHKRLADVINKTGYFLDPLIAVLAPGGGFWTPNGRHRLEAMRRLGAKSITALVIPEREVAWQILALNTEKAHNLKERSLEVIRIYRGLVDEDGSRPESGFAFYLDQAALVTLGVCYERVTRFGGGAYHPILRRLEDFSDESLRSALKQHEKRATMVLELEEKVAAVVKKLKERGLVSPYLRSFVVARINPLRWIKGEPPPLEDVLKTMRERVAKFNVEKIKPQDLAGAAGPPDDETERRRPRMTSSSARKHAGPGPATDLPPVPEPTFAERAHTLVYLGRMGSLSTLSRKQPGFPFGSVMPYGLDDHGRPIFLISTMAMHTQNLQADPHASLLVTQQDTEGEPLGASRVTLLGNVLPVPKPELAEARKLYLERHANSKYWVDFEDFSFYRMDVVDVYYVGGFGVMGWVSASDYDRSQPDPLADSMAEIIQHMNADHKDALVMLARTFAHIDSTEATMTAVDRLGFHVRLKTR